MQAYRASKAVTKLANERAQIREAIVALVGEHGYRNLSLQLILDRAGIEEGAFHRHFADLEDCFRQVFTELGEEFMLRMGAAFSRQQSWRDGLRAVAHTMLDWLKENPDRARFTFVESLNAGEPTQAIRDQFFSALFTLIDLGRQELDDPDSLTPATAAAVGGTIFNQIRIEIEAGNFDQLDKLAPKLTYTAVLPYVGAEAAARELWIPRPEPPAPAASH